jgi:hypothetical protein
MCKLDKPKFVESHIIPKAITTENTDPNFPAILASTDTSIHPKKVRVGIWSHIVCKECEDSFQNDDEYLIKVYRDLASAIPQNSDNVSLLESTDALRLQRSILSVMYRAHLSSHIHFSSVNLGPHAEDLRVFLRGKSFDAPRVFAVILRHLMGAYATGSFESTKHYFLGVNCYRLYIPRLTAIIKVDNQPFSKLGRDFQLTKNIPVRALRFDKLSDDELNIIAQTKAAQGLRVIEKLKGYNNKRSPKGDGR